MLDVSQYTSQCVAESVVRPRVATLKASMILRIVWQVRDLVANGHEVFNLTIGDFDPKYYPIPELIQDAVAKIPENEELGDKLIDICLVILGKAVKLTKTDMDDKLLETVAAAIRNREGE